MGAKVGALRLFDDGREWLDLRASFGASESYVNRPRLSVEDSLLGIVVRRKKPLQVETCRCRAATKNVEVARQEGLVALLSVPLALWRPGDWHPQRLYRPALPVSNEETRILSALAELSAIAIEKARLYERVVMWKSSCARTKSFPPWACCRRSGP